MTIRGHFDGKHVVLDEPVPADIPPQTPVKITFDGDPRDGVLDRIARLAGPGEGLPSDFSEQHDHYVKGTARK